MYWCIASVTSDGTFDGHDFEKKGELKYNGSKLAQRYAIKSKNSTTNSIDLVDTQSVTLAFHWLTTLIAFLD